MNNDIWDATAKFLEVLSDTQEFRIMTKDMNEEEKKKALFKARLAGKKIRPETLSE